MGKRDDDPTVEYRMTDLGLTKRDPKAPLSPMARIQIDEDITEFSSKEAYGHLALITLRLLDIPFTLDDIMVSLTLSAVRDDYFKDWKIGDLLSLIERLSEQELAQRCETPPETSED